MPSILLTVFILQIVIHIINSIGAATINNLLWILYNKLPTPTRRAVQEQTRLRREVVRLKREMAGVSAQDNFSKWAKLRRMHDKAVAEYDSVASSLTTTRATFDTTATTLRYILTNGLRFFLQWYYARTPLFWIPPGWVPTYVEWLLSFPRAPMGSVSVQVWGIACASVVLLASDAVKAAWVLLVQGRQGTGSGMGTEGRGQKVAMGMAVDGGIGWDSDGEKKEL